MSYIDLDFAQATVTFTSPPKPVGAYVWDGNKHLCAMSRPPLVHRFFMRHLLGLVWVDYPKKGGE